MYAGEVARALLLALLALWLAKPVLSGADDTRAWIVAVPGVDAATVRKQAGDTDARLHWLAPDFPSLDAPSPAGAPAVELLRGAAALDRHRSRTEGRLRAARLSSWLLLPLGVCTLPAFLTLGVAPMLLSVVSSSVLTF